jgi:hypothetical protein
VAGWLHARSMKTVFRRRHSIHSAGVEKNVASPSDLLMSSQTITSRSASAYGSGRSRIASKTLKIAAMPPMLSASVAMATAENAGLRRSCRNA